MYKKETRLEVADELKHLSSDEIEKAYARYMEGEKNSIIIRDYKIDVKPNNLIKTFPPSVLHDVLCIYCDIPMVKRRQRKTVKFYGPPPAECHKCGHKMYENKPGHRTKKCECVQCINIENNLRIKEFEETNKKTLGIYNIQNKVALDYTDLSFFQKLILLTLFRSQTGETLDFIKSLDERESKELLTPTYGMDVECIKTLHHCNALLVSPTSSIDSFIAKENFESFYIDKVQWIPNVALEGVGRVTGSELYHEIYQELHRDFQALWEVELYDILYKVAQEEVIQYVKLKSSELNVDFVAEDKTRKITSQLLHNFSVSEIYYFVKKSVENAHLYYAKGLAKCKRHAANTIPNKMLSLGERALTEKWNTYKYNRDSRAPRSHISVVLYEFFSQDEDAGFIKAPGMYWKEKIYDKYHCITNFDSNSDLSCSKCGSTKVVIIAVNKGLEKACNCCSDVALYARTGNKGFHFKFK